MKENPIRSLPGIPVLLILLLLDVVAIALPLTHGVHPGPAWIAATVVTFLMAGVYKVEPNQAAVLSLFGKYVGTVKQDGLRWNNPFYAKRKISLRVRNFESGRLKVNELDGSPIEIAAVIVWRVVDSAEAVFNVDDYESFVHIQSEAALRAMATSYPYDQHEEGDISLRSHPARPYAQDTARHPATRTAVRTDGRGAGSESRIGCRAAPPGGVSERPPAARATPHRPRGGSARRGRGILEQRGQAVDLVDDAARVPLDDGDALLLHGLERPEHAALEQLAPAQDDGQRVAKVVTERTTHLVLRSGLAHGCTHTPDRAARRVSRGSGTGSRSPR